MVRNSEPTLPEQEQPQDVLFSSPEYQQVPAVHLGSVVDVEFLGLDRYRLLLVDDPHTEFDRETINNIVTTESEVGKALLGRVADPEAIIRVKEHISLILHKVYTSGEF
jgi:transcription elongation GreA/GreB family factor